MHALHASPRARIEVISVGRYSFVPLLITPNLQHRKCVTSAHVPTESVYSLDICCPLDWTSNEFMFTEATHDTAVTSCVRLKEDCGSQQLRTDRHACSAHGDTVQRCRDEGEILAQL